MQKEKVLEYLKIYKETLGRCGHLKTEIDILTKEIEQAKSSIADDVASLQAQQITDMPHGTKIGNPTERAGLLLACGYETEYIVEKREKLLNYEREYNDAIIVVTFVEAWLKGLTLREKWIVEQQIIDGLYWRDVVTAFYQTFGDYISVDSLKRLRNRALDKIFAFAE